MDNRYSESELLKFMDWLANKGLLNSTTAKSRKIAAGKVLSALDEDEKSDLRTLDREQTFQRFSNKFSKDFTPVSLTTYKSRFNSALDDFIRWVDNPAGFKTNLTQKSSKAKSDEPNKPATKGKKVAKPILKPETPETPETQQTHSLTSVNFPIPIRNGIVVEIRNLPMDLNASEAERISAVVKALAMGNGHS